MPTGTSAPAPQGERRRALWPRRHTETTTATTTTTTTTIMTFSTNFDLQTMRSLDRKEKEAAARAARAAPAILTAEETREAIREAVVPLLAGLVATRRALKKEVADLRQRVAALEERATAAAASLRGSSNDGVTKDISSTNTTTTIMTFSTNFDLQTMVGWVCAGAVITGGSFLLEMWKRSLDRKEKEAAARAARAAPAILSAEETREEIREAVAPLLAGLRAQAVVVGDLVAKSKADRQENTLLRESLAALDHRVAALEERVAAAAATAPPPSPGRHHHTPVRVWSTAPTTPLRADPKPAPPPPSPAPRRRQKEEKKEEDEKIFEG
ncbi:hypothetical protein F4780DRAFT_776799 [Xylariomycetidae sp. FL0641]|nr:hypothetical protein F4780DRAFT_776799 [Xylariomycetidae sp. FL0641]